MNGEIIRRDFTPVSGGKVLKEEYVQAIIAILRQYQGELGDGQGLHNAAETILSAGLYWVRAFSGKPEEATIVAMIDELGRPGGRPEKIISVMTLAFVLGTTRMPTDVATGLFDELLYRLFSDESNDQLTAIKTIAAALYTTATDNSPF